MKAITIRNPWAWAIAMAEFDARAKNVENRSAGFPASYRGPLYVHAAKEPWAGQLDVHEPSHRALLMLRGRLMFRGDFATDEARSAVVAAAELVDVHPDGGCCRPWGESAYTGADSAQHRGVVHLVLEGAWRVPDPVPCRGALGLWTPPADVVAAVEAQR